MNTAARSQVLLSRIDRLPTTPTTSEDRDPRAAVADLALDGCLLGAFADVYPAGGTWWDRALVAVAAQAGVPAPVLRPENLDLEREIRPFHDDSPVTEAVLRLAHAGGLRAVTLERVAMASGRDPDWLVSMHGSAEGLVDALLERITEEAFDDLVPVHASGPPVDVALTAFASSHRVVALLRFLALTGVEVPVEAAATTRRLSPVAGEDLPDPVLVAALAVDAWTLGSVARGYPWPPALTPGVVAELRRLAAS
ncbi:hypothetical protein [Cellulomonas triticagri]|uniref:Uncharacterized protein n=1 Tax=Cellulomonas triticagri TaxID=2483352 RepID=A0A3M2J412_9CELL|nr:hypothetical protein [Cellulomonas triticagri]RMI06821.1 hypothetical protein EBM89_15050 [Cellulomonas triticagri]